LHLTAELVAYCLALAYSSSIYYFAQRQYYLVMFGLLQSRWGAAA